MFLCPAFAKSDEYLFDIKANGFRYGAFSVISSQVATNYSITVNAQAQGLFGLVLQAKYNGRSAGMFAENGARISTAFKAHSSRLFANRTAEVTFENGQPTIVNINPAKRRTALSDPERIPGPILDPLSFLDSVMLLPDGTCPKNQRMYDGRRITVISFEKTTIKNGVLACQGSYEIVEGPDHSLQRGIRRFNVILRYARVDGVQWVIKSLEFTSKNYGLILVKKLII
ncbi:MAG: hypothetical protein ACI9ZD_001406 [Paracoccaceae bacterium]|jgi:hypothetical protein